jgi:hypothetical protein
MVAKLRTELRHELNRFVLAQVRQLETMERYAADVVI